VSQCLAMRLDEGLVFLSDTRTNAGVDSVGTYRKLAELPLVSLPELAASEEPAPGALAQESLAKRASSPGCRRSLGGKDAGSVHLRRCGRDRGRRITTIRHSRGPSACYTKPS
jgi:hypothetical protein